MKLYSKVKSQLPHLSNSHKPKLGQILLSTLAAAFGVQSRKNHQRDIQHGKLSLYIISGVLFTVFFVLGIRWLVSQVLASHGL